MTNLIPVRTLKSDVNIKNPDFSVFTERYAMFWRSVIRYSSENGRMDGHTFYAMNSGDDTIRIIIHRNSHQSDNYVSFTLNDEFTLEVGDLDIVHLRTVMKEHIGGNKRDNVIDIKIIVSELCEFADDYYEGVG